MLQKHKWSKFLHENPDIKACWEKLPRTCSNRSKTLKKNKDREIVSIVDSSDDEINEEEDSEQTIKAEKIEHETQNKVQQPEDHMINLESPIINPMQDLYEEIKAFETDSSHQTCFLSEGTEHADETEGFVGGFLKQWEARSIKFKNESLG